MTFQILALSGGGYRGLFSIAVLSRLEKQAGRPIGECFDLIAGTSIGGIVAIGLAMGKRAEEIKNVFLERGEDIFPLGERPRGLWQKARSLRAQAQGPKYDGVELRRAVEDVIGKDTLLGDAKTRLLVPAVNMSKGQIQMFKTPHHPSLVIDRDRRATDVAMATSAAPLFFPLAKIDNSHFADGGLAANAPDLCAVHEAVHFLGQEDIRVLSIGTTTTTFSLPNSIGLNLGAIAWLTNRRLLSTVMSTQQQLVDFMMRHQLGDRYLRIDRQPSMEQTADLGLDLATKERRETLLALADAAYQDVAANDILRRFLAHQAEIPDFAKK